jgi:hypothetical protein
MAQFDSLPIAPTNLASTQIPPIVQWVYACPSRGCMTFAVVSQQGTGGICREHQRTLTYVGSVLEMGGMLYAQRPFSAAA